VGYLCALPILVFLGLSVLDLGPMYATDRRQTIVVTNVSNVIYNFERNGLSKVIYSEKVINLFQNK